MRSDDLIYRSVSIVTEYFKNDPEPFFAAVSDDVLWIGPARGQQLRGREDLKRLFAAERRELAFTVGDIKALCVSPDSHVREVLLRYELTTQYPGGNSDTHDRRLHLTWRDKLVKTDAGWEYRPEIVMVHISSVCKYDSHDMSCPARYENAPDLARSPAGTERFLNLKTPDMGIRRVPEDEVLFVETVKHSAKLRVHTVNGIFTVSGTLSEFEKHCPERFLRIHVGFLINPSHVREIRRFFVTLSDGTSLPIPEKRYTQVKKRLLGENT